MIDDLMSHVPKKWYYLQWSVLTAISTLILAGFALSHLVPRYAYLQKTFGFNTASLVLTIASLFYFFVIFWIGARKSIAATMFVGTLIHTLPMLNAMGQTAQTPSGIYYIIAWLFVGFLNGMFGLTILAGSYLLTIIFVLLETHFSFVQMTSSSYELLLGGGVVVVFGYFFWRKKFISKLGSQVSQLSGMLRSKEQQSEILIQSIADGIIVIDVSGRVTLINKAAAKLTSWPQKEAVGFDAKAVLRLLKDERSIEPIPDSEHPFTKILSDHKHISQTLQLYNRDNRKIFVSVAISPVILPKNNEFVGAVAVLRDVSAQKHEEAQRADFISTASHEMRTPVAAIEGYLALALNDNVSKIDEKARAYLEKAHVSTQHLGELFQDLLTSAKAEDNRLINHPVVTEMGEFVEHLAEDLRFSAQKKGLEMEFIINNKSDADSNSGVSTSKTIQPLYYVSVDQQRMREVITNIFDNAVKYTQKGKITIGITGNDKVVQMSISDTGPGIPSEDIPHLFQKFYRVDTSATRSIGGTGLGLFICRKIVELYNGTIWVDSKLGEGSKFYINLPRIPNHLAIQMQDKEQSLSRSQKLTGQPLSRG